MTKLRERFDLDQMIVVADGGMLSKDNLALLRSWNCDYVVAARLRSLNKVQTQVIVEDTSWKILPAGRKVREHKLAGRRLILRYCPKKAARDVKLRDKAIENVRNREVKGTGRAGRFLHREQDGVTEAAIEKDKKFDGLHGVWTSLEDPSPERIYQYYGELWRIEEGFRVMKHTMAVRPVFHWKERRVRAHLAICFVAFALLRILRHRYNARFGGKQRLSEGQILAELSTVETSIICDGGNQAHYLLPSKVTDAGARLYQTVGLKIQRETVLFKEGTST